MIRKFFILTAILTSLVCSAREIAFVTQTKEPLKDVGCIGYTASNDSVGRWESNDRGVINIDEDNVNYFIASKHGYSQRLIRLESLPSTNAQVILSPETDLKEVVVTPKDVEEFDTHSSYRLSQKDMARYTNVLQSLNEIPHLTVLPNGGVFYEGNENVKILVDGVDASLQEVQTLSKEDIAKVNVYRNPPARFLSQGVESVIDIRLKSQIHGGNGGLELSQAFQSLKGENSAAMYYNYRQSRFYVLYSNENRHFRKHRQTDVLDYSFDGIRYSKRKEGLDSRSHLDNNGLNLSYQVNRPQDFLYNVKAGVDFDRNGGTYHQRVSQGEEPFLATNYLHTGFTKYTAGNYFEKNFGEESGTLLSNVNFQHYTTKYSSAYSELRDDDGGFRDSRSDYRTRLNSVFSELQYEFPANRLGYFSLSAYEVYKHSRYVDSYSPFYQTSNTLGAMGLWIGRKKRVSWVVSLGVDWLHSGSAALASPYNLCMPSSRINLSWRPTSRLRLALDYSYTGNTPSIAQLSETDQWLDTRLVYHGNSALKPYRTHHLGMSMNLSSKYVNLSMQNSLNISPDMICDMYTSTDSYMLQTLVNLSEYRYLGSRLDISVMPMGNHKLVFWNRVILADIKGSNREYSWHGYRFQWMSTLSLNLDHWTFQLYYQYPGKASEGQLVRPRAQCWSATAYYRPVSNLSVGLECFMPFGRGVKESEYTVKDAPVFSSNESRIMDYNNLISVKLSYNFSFGRNHNSARPQFTSGDNDSGILRK
ncbi:MAG: hypothetical protein K2G23_08315 [Muribaculaceae bacterium]|nr:hypothetical protein [Muribaculaceae bacterium]